MISYKISPHLSGLLPAGFSTFSASRNALKHLGCRASSGLFPQPLLIRFQFADNIIYFFVSLSTLSCIFSKIVYTIIWYLPQYRLFKHNLRKGIYIWKTNHHFRYCAVAYLTAPAPAGKNFYQHILPTPASWAWWAFTCTGSCRKTL